MAPGPDGSVRLGGQELFLGGATELVEAIAALLPTRELHSVITPNVDQVLNLRTDGALGAAYDEASIRITDGFPLVVLGHRLGARRLERLTGADLLPLAAQVAAERGWRIALT
ncbi:MAG: glycosyltransferase, partial [Actinomycetota bacterium]|nr:glycosyltransferase [Actinomycetota bacterium]